MYRNPNTRSFHSQSFYQISNKLLSISAQITGMPGAQSLLAAGQAVQAEQALRPHWFGSVALAVAATIAATANQVSSLLNSWIKGISFKLTAAILIIITKS